MRYLFEDYVLDTGTRELRRGDTPVAVEPMAFDLLVYLIEHRAGVVSKDDLIAHVWEGRTVSIRRCSPASIWPAAPLATAAMPSA